MKKSAFLLIFIVLLVLLSSGSVSATWFNESKAYKMPINCTNLDYFTPIVINGSNGFEINGEKQIIWTYCSGTGTAVYYNDETDIVVANDLIQLPTDCELSNSTFYNPTGVWDANFRYVGLFGNGIYDSSGNDYGLSVNGAIATSDGKINGAYGYSDPNDRIDYTSGMIGSSSADFTMTAFFYPNKTGEVNYLWDDASPSGGYFYEVVVKADNVIEGEWYNSGKTATTNSVNANTWNFITITKTGTNLTIKLNNDASNQGTDILTDTTNPVVRYGIGGFGDGVNNFNGVIDHFIVSNVSRSGAYISQMYQNVIETSGYGDLGAEESAPSGGAPTVTAHATSPTTVYTNTDFKFNMTATDSDNVSFMGYVQFYINGSASGSTVSQAIDNNTNTLIGTLANANFIKGSELIAEYWAGNGEENTTKANQSTVTVQSLPPTIYLQNTFINCSAGHRFNVTAGIQDLDGGSEITKTNISTSTGTCQHYSNTTSGNYFNVTFNCSGIAFESTNIIIGFNDSSGNYAETTLSANVYPDHPPTDPTDITGFPANIYVTDTLTINATGGTDADSDAITYHYKFYNINDATTRQEWSATNTYTIQVSDAHDTIRVYAKSTTAYANSSGSYYEDDFVDNSVPTIPTTLTLTNPIYTGNTLTATGSGSTDTDDDSLTYYYEFYNVNDAVTKQAYSTDNTYIIQLTDSHDLIRVRTKAYDEIDYSGEKETNRTVSNTAPSPTLNAPTDGAIDQLLNTTLNITVIDADSDLMNVSFYQLGGSVGVGVLNYTTATPTTNCSITTGAIADLNDDDFTRADMGSTALTEYCYFQLDFTDDYTISNITVPQITDGSGFTTQMTLNISVYVGTTKVLEYYYDGDDEPTARTFTILPNVTGSYVRTVFHNLGADYKNIFFDELEVYGGVALIGNATDITTGSDATFDWSGLDFNTTYEWYAVITDGTNETTTPVWNFTTFAFPLSITAGPYPENNTGINTLPVNFNLTMLALEDFNCTLMINSTENTTGDYGSGAAVSVSFDETLDDGYWEYYITCEDKIHGTLINSTINTIFVDTQNPAITINPNNAFTATNTSTIDNYQSIEFPLDITFADERDLFAMEINITNSTGHTVFNRTNTSLSGTSYNYIETVNNSNWTAGIYTIELIVSDSHTSSLIGDYEPIKLSDKLVFLTTEDNLITIEAVDAISSDTIQKYDRYLFEFSYPKTKTTDIVYNVKSDNKIYYRPDSDYKAHFIIWNPATKTGNWIDFEDVTLKDYTVGKVNDNHYIVTFKMPIEGIDIIKFNSIGGLNVHTEYYEWFRGSTTQTYTDPVLTNVTTSFYLDVTNTSSISDIDARFFYNYAEYTVTETTSDDYNFVATITVPTVETGSQTFNFTWNVTVTQTDATHYNFSETGNQTITTANINITIRDELNQSLITEELDVFVINEGRSYKTSTGSILIGNLTAGIPYIEIENANYPRRGYYITISENITTYLTSYLLRSTVSTQEVVFNIQSSDLDKIEDAKMTFYRMVNMSYVSVGQIETDYAGQAALTLDTTNEYRIVIEADGFPIKSLDLRPLQSTYTITLQVTGAGFENVFEGIAYTITPTNRSTNVSQNYTDFRLDIYSSNSDLELFGVRTFAHSYECIPASCTQNITGSAAGGSAIVRVKGNTTGTIKIDVYYKRIDYNITYLNFNIYSFVQALAAHARSLWESMKTVRSEYSPIILALIAVIGTIMLLGTAAEIGVYGLPLIVIAAFGLIFFAMVGFINPLIVGLSLILGGIVYFRFSGGAD